MTTAARRRSKRELEAPGRPTRVAIYTRKSTDDGLDQAFNSLDAQRQAVEAYVESQRGEGWVALEERYDDGGFSGGNTDRPAFQRLLRDIEAGKVDVVGVYKMDRLSRSVLDFLQTMEFFRKHGVTFVSVTQRIDTTGSMGELMSHLLVAFGQFERKVISERTADKMGAARRKGMWTGGSPILGYHVVEKRLVVNAEETSQVQEIFQLYLALGSLLPVVAELKHRGWQNKTWTTEAGRVVPGRPFDKTALRRLLTNPTYIGKVAHRGELFDGIHEAIVDQGTWDAVQDLLKAQRREKGPRTRSKWGMLLQGLVRCAVCGAGMTTHYAVRGHKRYTYYTCLTGQKQGAAACRGSRVAAGRLEAAVVARVRAIGGDPELIGEALRAVGREVKHLRPDLEERLRKLEDERERFQGEARNLVSALGKGQGNALIHQRLGELHAAIANAEAAAHEARVELEALDGRVIDPEDLRRAIESFDPVWGELFPAERVRILRLLIERVTYDGRTREVRVQFRPGGVRALAGEGEERTKLA